MLKITSGILKGRSLKEPPKDISRPTIHRVKQALFNILIHQYDSLDGKVVLDAFSGSGAFGFEALSHQALKAYFIENNFLALSALKENIKTLNVQSSATVLNQDFFNVQAPQPVDYIFLDPPYGQFEEGKLFSTLIVQRWLKPTTIVIFEKDTSPSFVGKDSWIHLNSRNYGCIFLEFWKIRSEFLL